MRETVFKFKANRIKNNSSDTDRSESDDVEDVVDLDVQLTGLPPRTALPKAFKIDEGVHLDHQQQHLK